MGFSPEAFKNTMLAGVVRPEDRARWDAQIQAGRQQKEKGVVRTSLSKGVRTGLELAEKGITMNMQAAAIASAEASQQQRRTVRTQTTIEQSRFVDEMSPDERRAAGIDDGPDY